MIGNKRQFLPHQQRVVDEKIELDVRRAALTAFIQTETSLFHTLGGEEQSRLRRQRDVMAEYSEILGSRIAAFLA